MVSKAQTSKKKPCSASRILRVSLREAPSRPIKKAALETSTEIPQDFDFNQEFRQAFDMMDETKSSIFITGKAGTGKSTLLE